jgi:hypothetical protein
MSLKNAEILMHIRYAVNGLSKLLNNVDAL